MNRTVSTSMIALTVVLGLATSAPAGNLVQNGKFETLTTGSVNAAFPSVSNGYLAAPLALADWNFPSPSTGYLFGPGAADGLGAVALTIGVTNYYVGLWGPGNGSPNGFPVAIPGGGNFLAVDDPVEYPNTLTQTINGLTAGEQYALSFDWAAAQVYLPGYGFNGITHNQISASLGAETYSTSLVTIESHGFSGWLNQTFTFTATASSEVLSFLMVSPDVSTTPPAALLTNVSLTAVPEPATWAMMLVGLFGLGGAARRRRAASACPAG